MERSLAARKMTQVLKAAGGVAESQEPPRSLTSTILSRSTKAGAACHGGEAQKPHYVRAGTAPSQGLRAPPVKMDQGLERNRAHPGAHEEGAAKTGRESHLLTSDPDQTPSLPFPSHIGLLTVLSGHVHDLFPPIPLQELGRERGQLAKEHHWASPGASSHQEDTVWDTQTGSYGNSGPVVSFPPCELIMPRLHEVCTSPWSPHCPPEQSHCSSKPYISIPE